MERANPPRDAVLWGILASNLLTRVVALKTQADLGMHRSRPRR
jgi:hypothetical protein